MGYFDTWKEEGKTLIVFEDKLNLIQEMQKSIEEETEIRFIDNFKTYALLRIDNK